MEQNSSNNSRRFALLPAVAMATMVVFVCSCSREAHVASDVVVTTNDTEISSVESRLLNPEEQEVELMNDMIAEEKTQTALRHARNLMDSTNVSVRVSVIEALSWIGKRALPEITEMLNDASGTVATEALTAWEHAYAEIDGRHRQGMAIADTVVRLKNPDHVNAILLHLSGIDMDVALPTLSKIIETNPTNFIGECAREMYSHVTGGEVYESQAAMRRFLEIAQKSDNLEKANGEKKP